MIVHLLHKSKKNFYICFRLFIVFGVCGISGLELVVTQMTNAVQTSHVTTEPPNNTDSIGRVTFPNDTILPTNTTLFNHTMTSPIREKVVENTSQYTISEEVTENSTSINDKENVTTPYNKTRLYSNSGMSSMSPGSSRLIISLISQLTSRDTAITVAFTTRSHGSVSTKHSSTPIKNKLGPTNTRSRATPGGTGGMSSSTLYNDTADAWAIAVAIVAGVAVLAILLTAFFLVFKCSVKMRFETRYSCRKAEEMSKLKMAANSRAGMLETVIVSSDNADTSGCPEIPSQLTNFVVQETDV